MNKKILILGAEGMAGHMVRAYLEEKEYEVHATIRKKNVRKDRYLDVLVDFKELEKIISDIKPDFVVNCIGVLVQFSKEDKSAAILINSFLPHYINSLSEKYNFKLIHLSTDCVFSGARGNYFEKDFTDADSFYGRTKALGEINNKKNLTFRTSIVGPEIIENGGGLFNWFMRQEGKIKGFRKVIWTGVTTLELAKAIEKSLSINVTGLYHLVNNEKISKYELLNLFKKYMNKNVIIVENDSCESDKSLINSRKDFNFNIPSYNEMVAEMCKWIDDHEEKYKQIILNKDV